MKIEIRFCGWIKRFPFLGKLLLFFDSGEGLVLRANASNLAAARQSSRPEERRNSVVVIPGQKVDSAKSVQACHRSQGASSLVHELIGVDLDQYRRV